MTRQRGCDMGSLSSLWIRLFLLGLVRLQRWLLQHSLWEASERNRCVLHFYPSSRESFMCVLLGRCWVRPCLRLRTRET